MEIWKKRGLSFIGFNGIVCINLGWILFQQRVPYFTFWSQWIHFWIWCCLCRVKCLQVTCQTPRPPHPLEKKDKESCQTGDYNFGFQCILGYTLKFPILTTYSDSFLTSANHQIMFMPVWLCNPSREPILFSFSTAVHFIPLFEENVTFFCGFSEIDIADCCTKKTANLHWSGIDHCMWPAFSSHWWNFHPQQQNT